MEKSRFISQQQLFRAEGSICGWALQPLPGRCLRWTAARWNRRPSICAWLRCTAGMEAGGSGQRSSPLQRWSNGLSAPTSLFFLWGDLSHNQLRNLIKSLQMFAPRSGKRRCCSEAGPTSSNARERCSTQEQHMQAAQAALWRNIMAPPVQPLAGISQLPSA